MFRYRKSDDTQGIRRTSSTMHRTFRKRFNSSVDSVEDENILLNNIKHDFQQMMPMRALKLSCI